MTARETPARIITLIHGTFAAHAKWTGANSALSQHIAKTSTKRRPEFNKFIWNGRNDHTSRMSAVKDLAKHVENNIQQSNAVEQWIIAHSHGGNISLHAAAQTNDSSQLRGIVCMSTPFFNLKRREVIGSITRLANAISWFLALSTLVMLVMWTFFDNFQHSSTIGVPQDWEDVIWYLRSAAIAIIYLLLYYFFVRRVSAWIEKTRTNWENEFRFEPLNNIKILVLQASGDEVRLAFRLAKFLSSVSTFLLSGKGIGITFVLFLVPLLLQGNEAVYLVQNWFGDTFFEAVVIGVLPLALIFEHFFWESINDLVMPLFAVLISIIVVALFSILSLLVAMLIQYLATIGRFGWESRWRLFSTILFDVRVEEVPTGIEDVEYHKIKATGRGLAHSAVYSSPQALALIEHFIADSGREN